MQTFGSVASVIAAIREDAAADGERIDEALAAQTSTIRAEGVSVSVAVPDREARLAAARAASQERIARQEWEGRRLAIEQREAWIERVIAKSREQRRTSAAQLMALIHEALRKIDSAECEVAVAESDRHLVDVAKLGRVIRLTTAPIEGGCIVSAGDLVFDNSLEARARRLEPEWRSAVSEAYRP